MGVSVMPVSHLFNLMTRVCDALTDKPTKPETLKFSDQPYKYWFTCLLIYTRLHFPIDPQGEGAFPFLQLLVWRIATSILQGSAQCAFSQPNIVCFHWKHFRNWKNGSRKSFVIELI